MEETVSESWIIKHARENPGHRTTETLTDPGSCQTCDAKSPAYDLPVLRSWSDEDYSELAGYDLIVPGDANMPAHLRRPDPDPGAGIRGFRISEAQVLADLTDMVGRIKSHPVVPLPDKIEVTPAVLDAIKRWGAKEGDDEEPLTGSTPTMGGSLGAMLGIPVVVDDTVPYPGWRFVTEPKVGDPCVRCGQPTSYATGFVKNRTQIAHVFCPGDDEESSSNP
jgi:hypothetical protein